MWDWGTYFLFVFVVLISFIFLRKYDKERGSNIYWLVIGLIPTYMLMVLRGRTVGIDLDAYEEHILDVPYISFSDMPILLSEPISEFIYWLSYILGGLRSFIFITSTLHYLFLFISFKELHKRKIEVGVFFIFYYAVVVTRSYNIVLNCLAITCSLCAYVNLLSETKQSKMKYWFFSIVALCIHNTALINIPIYFICKPIKNNIKKSILFRMLLMVLVTLFCVTILTTYIDTFTDLSSGQYSKYESLGKAGWGIILSKLPFILLVLCFRKQMQLDTHSIFMPFLLLLIFDIIFAQVRYVYPGIERISMYTNISSLILINLLLFTLYKKIGNVILLLFVLWGCGSLTYWLYLYNVVGGDGQGVGLMPYHLWS